MEIISNNNANFWQMSKRIFSLALPMTGSQLISVASGFLCMAMIAQLGQNALAASALIFGVELSIVVTGISILFSLSVLIGHAYGEKNDSAIGIYLQQGWTLALCISVPIIFLFWNIKGILIYFGQSKDIATIVQTYFHAFVWSVIPEFLSVCNQQFGYGIHKKWLIVSASIMSVMLLLLISYVLIFGKFGFPELGVAGLGYARAVQNLFFFAFTTLFFYFESSFKRFEIFKYRVHQHLNYFSKMLKVGWPICIQMGGEMLSVFVISLMIGWLGTNALAAFQVINQYCFLLVISIFSLSQASGILVGYALGAKQYHEVKKLGHVSIVWVLVITLVVACIFIFAPNYLASLYLSAHETKNTELVHLIVMIFLISAFSQIFDGLRHILFGLLRGLLDTQFPMYSSLFIIWIIGVPLSYVLAFPLRLGVVGIVMGGTISMFIGALVLFYRWYNLCKKYP